MSVVFKDKSVITRRAHECFGCGYIWPAGTKMRHFVGVPDDCDFSSVYTCEVCEELVSHYKLDWAEIGKQGVVPDDSCVEDWDAMCDSLGLTKPTT